MRGTKRRLSDRRSPIAPTRGCEERKVLSPEFSRSNDRRLHGKATQRKGAKEMFFGRKGRTGYNLSSDSRYSQKFHADRLSTKHVSKDCDED